MLLLMLFTTFVARAQDDVYFVPTKKNKANDVKGANDVYFVDVEEYLTDDDSHLSDSDSTYASYADDLLQQYDDSAYYAESHDLLFDSDFRYSARIVRFRNPDRLFGNPHYWDLLYGYGINDWLVYDTGYSLDIYPTASNPFYYWNGRWPHLLYSHGWRYTNWTWYMDNCTWYGINNHWAYFTPIWHHYPVWHNHYPVWGHGWHGSWNTAHIVHNDIPTNIYAGKVNQGRTRGERPATLGTGTKGRGGTPSSRATIRTDRRKHSADDHSLRDADYNKDRSDFRITGRNGGKRSNEEPSMRRNRPPRGAGNAYASADKDGENMHSRTIDRKDRQRPSRQGALSSDMGGNRDAQSGGRVLNGRQQKRDSSSGTKVGNGSNRRGGGGMNLREQRRNSNYSDGTSSGSYNRPSSTSVSRSRNNSSDSSGSSYRSSGSSSRSSGSSYRSSGSSSRSSGSSSRGSSGGGGRGGRR